jgi:predicted ATPase
MLSLSRRLVVTSLARRIVHANATTTTTTTTPRYNVSSLASASARHLPPLAPTIPTPSPRHFPSSSSSNKTTRRTFSTFGDGAGKTPRSPHEVYDYLKRKGRIHEDAFQEEVVNDMDAAHAALLSYAAKPPSPPPSSTSSAASAASASWPKRDRFHFGSTDLGIGHSSAAVEEAGAAVKSRLGGLFSSLFSKKGSSTSSTSSASPPSSSSSSSSLQSFPQPRGFYLFGAPGCGKTFLMDLAYRCAPAALGKRRVHFNSFMLDVHRRIHAWRKEKRVEAEATSSQTFQTETERAGAAGGGGGDPIPPLADALAKESRYLCFDEFQVGCSFVVIV